jgi:hypothetical protein
LRETGRDVAYYDLAGYAIGLSLVIVLVFAWTLILHRVRGSARDR